MNHIDAHTARIVDEVLTDKDSGHSIEQLMELAGVAVSAAAMQLCREGEILIICGPGNNGGDGLVAARHLHLHGYQVTVLIPKPMKGDLCQRLVKQLELHAVTIVTTVDDVDISSYTLIVDSIFGFSFSGGEIREPYKAVIELLASLRDPSNPGSNAPGDSPVILSVDIPSGWNVNSGPENVSAESRALAPHAVISLTAPKKCMEAAAVHGVQKHFLGGRFLSEHALRDGGPFDGKVSNEGLESLRTFSRLWRDNPGKEILELP